MINVSDVFIDKIAVTVDLEIDSIEGIRSNLDDLVKDKSENRYHRNKDFDDGYRHRYKIYIDDMGIECFCLSLKSRRNSNPKSLRVEWNPRSFRVRERNYFNTTLEKLLLNEYEIFLLYGKVTRIDCSVDIWPLKPEGIMIDASYLQLSKTFNGSKANIESHYIGGDDSTTNIVLYDKNKECIKKRKSPPKEQTTRLEIRKKRLNLQLTKLQLIANLFQQVKVYGAVKNSDYNALNTEQRLFLSLARCIGLPAALKEIKNRREKQSMKKLIEELSQIEWWEPNKFYNQLYRDPYTLAGLHCGYPRKRRVRRKTREVICSIGGKWVFA